MTLLSYWTIPYVCLEDARLVWLYNLAFLTVISSLLANIFCHMTYLQSDNLSGIAQVITINDDDRCKVFFSEW